MPMFVKKPVPVEAVRFTGDNWAEMHAFTGHHETGDGHPVDTFNPIGTYLPNHQHPLAKAELWVEANQAWLPIVVGEWVMRDQYGFYPCQGDEEAPENYEPKTASPGMMGIEPSKEWAEFYVRDANGNLQGPWSERACKDDVRSGEGGVEVLRRDITESVLLRVTRRSDA